MNNWSINPALPSIWVKFVSTFEVVTNFKNQKPGWNQEGILLFWNPARCAWKQARVWLSFWLIPPDFCLVQANIGWGAECQAYKMSVRAETAHLPGSKPTFKANLNWSKIPESMAEFGVRWAGSDTEQGENHQMEHNNFSLLCTLFYFNLSQDWEIHSRHGIPFWLLPGEWKQCQTGSVRLSDGHLGR